MKVLEDHDGVHQRVVVAVLADRRIVYFSDVSHPFGGRWRWFDTLRPVARALAIEADRVVREHRDAQVW